MTRSGTTDEVRLRQEEAQPMLQWVERARKLEPLGQVVIAQAQHRDDLLLENCDIVRVPVKNGLVLVHGEVLFPNAVVSMPGTASRTTASGPAATRRTPTPRVSSLCTATAASTKPAIAARSALETTSSCCRRWIRSRSNSGRTSFRSFTRSRSPRKSCWTKLVRCARLLVAIGIC